MVQTEVFKRCALLADPAFAIELTSTASSPVLWHESRTSRVDLHVDPISLLPHRASRALSRRRSRQATEKASRYPAKLAPQSSLPRRTCLLNSRTSIREIRVVSTIPGRRGRFLHNRGDRGSRDRLAPLRPRRAGAASTKDELSAFAALPSSFCYNVTSRLTDVETGFGPSGNQAARPLATMGMRD